MEKKKADYQVFTTTDYDSFRILDGNRNITQARVNKIKRSIEAVGYIHNPIIVNEKHEIIDGQGRYTALKDMGLPIEYIVHDGAGVEECRSMNIQQSNWTTKDYIKSYADLNNVNYKYLSALMKKYDGIPFSVIQYAVTGSTKISSDIVNGTFICGSEQYDNAQKKLSYLMDMMPYLIRVAGFSNLLEASILFIYDNCECDLSRLKNVVKDNIHKIRPIGNMEESIADLERLYNYRLRGSYVDFQTKYKIYLKAHKRGGNYISTDKRKILYGNYNTNN